MFSIDYKIRFTTFVVIYWRTTFFNTPHYFGSFGFWGSAKLFFCQKAKKKKKKTVKCDKIDEIDRNILGSTR